MTWSVTVFGHSKQGADTKEDYEYLVEEFFDPIQEILNKLTQDDKTVISSAVLNTNYGVYDLVSGKEIARTI